MTRFLQVAGNYVVGPSGGAFAVPAPTVALSLVSGDLYEGNVATFRATLSKAWIVGVDVTYATSNGTASAGTDYTAASGTVTITAGDTFVDIPVTTTLRSGVQASRTFTLTLSAAVDADGEALVITDDDVTVTILDTEVAPDAPSLTVAAVAPADEGDPLTFRVTAAYPFEEDITFSYTTGDGTGIAGVDYTSTSGTGTITAETLTDDIAVSTTLRVGYQGPRTVTLTISNAETASEVPVTITSAVATGTIAETELLTGEHGYFETLIARADYWKGLSFRPIAGRPQVYASGDQAGKLDPYYALQLARPADGGYAESNAVPLSVTYSPGTDSDPNAQDAAKAVIPRFDELPSATLGADLAPSDTTINLGTGRSFDNGTSFLVGTEIVTISAGKPIATATVPCVRARFGTTAQSHTAGISVYRSGNSLPNQVRLTLGTTAGEGYFYTWDTLYTDSYLRQPALGETTWLKNHKAFQFTSKSAGGKIWMEPATRFSSSGNAPSPAPGYDNTIHVAEADWRSYMTISTDTVFNPAAPNNHPSSVTRIYPTRPMDTMFIIHPNRWTRWFVHMDHRIDDYDLLNVWMADEVQDPVQILTNLPIKAWEPTAVNGVVKQWWMEMDTSDSENFRWNARDLVSYIRNFVALRDVSVADITSLLVKPE